jgi:hypothetical protein
MMLRAGFVLLCLVCFMSLPAFAHTPSESHSNWRLAGRVIHLTFTLPDADARRLAPKTQTVVSDRAVMTYLSRHLTVRSDKQPCRIGPGEVLSANPAVHRYEFTFQCPSDKNIEVGSSAFFELVPTHTNYAQIQLANGDFIEQLITRDQQTLDVEKASGNELKDAGFLKYVELGVLHIFTGVDHQCFLLGLIMLSRRLKDLTFVITGFTLGHSLTLALAVTGVLRPHGEYIDALIGLTIALVGSELVSETTKKPAIVAFSAAALLALMALGRVFHLGGLPVLLLLGGGLFSSSYLMVAGRVRDAARLRLVVTLVFGLIHGFGFAAGLLEMKLPAGNLAELLLGFNLGVEIGQLTLVLAVVGIAAMLVRFGLSLPRRMVTDLSAAFLVGIGLFWFVSRSYS